MQYGALIADYRDQFTAVMEDGEPEGSYFYLGDNRPVSNDSRQMGCISKNQLRGKVLLTFRR